MKRLPIFLATAIYAAPAFADLSPEFNGLWQTDGYGTIAKVQDGNIKFYQFAGDICIEESGDAEALLDLIGNSKLVLTKDRNTATVTLPFAQHQIRADRLEALPDTCQTSIENTPAANFEAFAAFFRHNYPFHDIHGVDWQSTIASAREKIQPEMTDEQLFEVFKQMMSPLQDGHLDLTARIDNEVIRFEPYPGDTLSRLSQDAKDKGVPEKQAVEAFFGPLWYDSIPNTILGGQGRVVGNQRIQYGVLNGDTGYLALATVGYYDRRGASPDEEMAATNAIMEEIMQFFQTSGVRSVIVDLSMNFGGYNHFGGYEFVARAIAERFASEPVQAFTKYAADAEKSPRTVVTLTPSSGTRFEGPVHVLTSDITVSAAEVLVLSLRALPNVRHIGKATRGAASDVLGRTLPNGWYLSLANEVHVDNDGRFWEGRGIEPDVEMTVFDQASPVEAHANLIRKLANRN
ncbi:S41 family peptidase [uncultured Roseibium sp.]|uniref:S41 family peptidase n=1 Tax=uncultured Roseibium sp. TaxID=1936171 RepID=UPI0026069F6B|nr:S41 family peptidase [uncultured Roseibium sp.]